MASGQHASFKGTESIITLSICLLTDLVFLDLADIIELIVEVLSTLIDHMYSVALLRVVFAESLVIIHHLRNWLCL